MSNIDKSFVKKSFNDSAAGYDRHAGLQKRRIEALTAFAEAAASPGSRVLDIGMGTGNLTARLRDLFPSARIFGADLAVNMVRRAREKLEGREAAGLYAAADAEYLPYLENSFDLVVSSFTYQWLESWGRALGEVRRVLKPDGLFAFSAFGRRTFFELRDSYNRACRATGYRRGKALRLTVTEEKIFKALAEAGFLDPRTSACSVVERYGSVHELVRAIKGMGARNASGQRNRTLGVRRTWREMVALYENDFGSGQSIPATFEIVMGRGRKPLR